MADQHNSNIPALTNQVAEDIPDIRENLEFHRDSFEMLFETWSATDNSSSKMRTATGFSDGTYNYEFPTNGVGASSVIMLGTSSTVVWMYLNTAPPGWKALSTGADSVIAVSGGTGDYNVNGGNPDSSQSWTPQAAHNHQWYNFINNAVDGQSYDSSGNAQDLDSVTMQTNLSWVVSYNATARNGISEDQYTDEFDPGSAWRPSASVGKLFQLDTA